MPSLIGSVADALRASVPTSRHAQLLFDVLADTLGDQGVVWTGNEGRLRRLFRRDPIDATLVVPWPVAQLALGGRIGFVSETIDFETGEVVAPPERPSTRSRLRGLGAGELEVGDGAAIVQLVYGDDGGWRESGVGEGLLGRLGEIPVALASRRAPPVERIASAVALFDPGVHGPGRVRLPVPVPGGPGGSWAVALAAARRALFSGAVPDDARYLVADGVSGSAVGFGPTLAAATALFEERVAASPPAPDTTCETAWDDYDDDGNLLRRGELPDALAEGFRADEVPWRPPPPPGVIPLTGEPVRLHGPTPDVPLPPISVATVPRAIFPLAGPPPLAPPLGRWARTIGAKGATGHVARLVRPQGFLQVGERVLWRVDPRTLDETLDLLDAEKAEEEAATRARSSFEEFVRYRSRAYHWTQPGDGVPARLELVTRTSGPHFDGRDLDGDVEPFRVRRHVRVPRPT